MTRAAFALLALVLATPIPARDVVKAEVILMRHGVRSPTKPASLYRDVAKGEWPAWPVGPGMLTAHGAQGMQRIGARLGTILRDEGALPAGCDAVVVIGDSTARNRESSVALARGLLPACPPRYLATAGDTNNPLFHYRKDADGDDAPVAPSVAPAALADLQALLLDCHGDACARVAGDDGKRLLLPTPDQLGKALKLAGTLSENLMLAYAEGMPMAQVAFGRGDAALLGRLITLHNAQFAATKRAMPTAAAMGSNLAAHIAATLAVGTTARPLTNHGVVVLVGHDTNLANVAGVLDLDWHEPTRPDDYPPGGALAFARVEHDGKAFIRVRAWMPSMDQLRTNTFDGMRPTPVRIAGCSKEGECTVAEFARVVATGVDERFVDEELPAMTKQ